MRQKNFTCTAPGCDRKAHARQLCSVHLGQMNRYGAFIRKAAPPGDGCIDPNGYRKMMVNGVSTYEHRLMIENHIGRKLLPTEHIHHINGNRLDNRIENLQIVDRAEHNKIHGKRGQCQSTTQQA